MAIVPGEESRIRGYRRGCCPETASCFGRVSCSGEGNDSPRPGIKPLEPRAGRSAPGYRPDNPLAQDAPSGNPSRATLSRFPPLAPACAATFSVALQPSQIHPWSFDPCRNLPRHRELPRCIGRAGRMAQSLPSSLPRLEGQSRRRPWEFLTVLGEDAQGRPCCPATNISARNVFTYSRCPDQRPAAETCGALVAGHPDSSL